MKCRCRSKPVAAEDPSEAKVFSGYYLTRLEKTPWLSFILQGTKQDSNVSTLGGAAVAGRGEILGARAMITLPPGIAPGGTRRVYRGLTLLAIMVSVFSVGYALRHPWSHPWILDLMEQVGLYSLKR